VRCAAPKQCNRQPERAPSPQWTPVLRVRSQHRKSDSFALHQHLLLERSTARFRERTRCTSSRERRRHLRRTKRQHTDAYIFARMRACADGGDANALPQRPKHYIRDLPCSRCGRRCQPCCLCRYLQRTCTCIEDRNEPCCRIWKLGRSSGSNGIFLR